MEIQKIPIQSEYNLEINHENVILYKIDYQKLVNEIKTILKNNFISDLRNSQQFIPIKLGNNEFEILQNLNNRFVKNSNDKLIPINQLIFIKKTKQYKSIFSNINGEFLRLIPKEKFNLNKDNLKNLKESFSQSSYDINFDGIFLARDFLIKELFFVILVSILLLYLIMAAQFNSLTQPFIILVEIPINIGGALMLVWMFGGDINMMTGIGIVIMGGIVINDSILKIHTMNQLRTKGYTLDEAIKEGGIRRFKPILMTSLTSILALTPFLFIKGLGSDLQKPLALSVIGGLIVGTFISLYFLPSLYKWISTARKV
jgi:multidrug efflux pump subunit AcrB